MATLVTRSTGAGPAIRLVRTTCSIFTRIAVVGRVTLVGIIARIAGIATIPQVTASVILCCDISEVGVIRIIRAVVSGSFILFCVVFLAFAFFLTLGVAFVFSVAVAVAVAVLTLAALAFTVLGCAFFTSGTAVTTVAAAVIIGPALSEFR
ncbi:MAG: hypothetical protein P1U65_13435, partial [Minwuia sp.]|nr:hypothetical protein [Minwuia sp.]